MLDGRAPARHIKSCPLHRPPAATKAFAVDPFDLQVLGLLSLVKVLNAAVCQLECVAQVRGCLLPGLDQLFRGHLQRLRTEPIEAFGELNQGPVALVFDLGEDLLDGVRSLLLRLSSGALGEAI